MSDFLTYMESGQVVDALMSVINGGTGGYGLLIFTMFFVLSMYIKKGAAVALQMVLLIAVLAISQYPSDIQVIWYFAAGLAIAGLVYKLYSKHT